MHQHFVGFTFRATRYRTDFANGSRGRIEDAESSPAIDSLIRGSARTTELLAVDVISDKRAGGFCTLQSFFKGQELRYWARFLVKAVLPKDQIEMHHPRLSGWGIC